MYHLVLSITCAVRSKNGVRRCCERTRRSPPPLTSTLCTFFIPKENSVEVVQCSRRGRVSPYTQDKPGLLRDWRRSMIYRA